MFIYSNMFDLANNWDDDDDPSSGNYINISEFNNLQKSSCVNFNIIHQNIRSLF